MKFKSMADILRDLGYDRRDNVDSVTFTRARADTTDAPVLPRSDTAVGAERSPEASNPPAPGLSSPDGAAEEPPTKEDQ